MGTNRGDWNYSIFTITILNALSICYQLQRMCVYIFRPTN